MTPPQRGRMHFDGAVSLVVSNLEYGGAQRQVAALASQLARRGVATHVVSLSDYTPLASGLDPGACLHVVKKHHRFDVTVVWRLAGLLRRLRTDVTHAFLFDAEIAARLAGALQGRTIVIGSERNADYRPRRRHRVALRVTNRWCDAIIANSNAGKRFRERVFGAPADSVFVVHNGVDTQRFTPGDAPASRARLGLEPGSAVVGLFASFKAQKNHMMFFRMARAVLERCPQAVFLCVGAALHDGLEGSREYEARMRSAAHELGIGGRLRFLGNRDDVVSCYRACDVTVLTSRHEGTPNVLLESMACGVPVVATDVADNALLVRDGVGFVVPSDADGAMAAHVADLLLQPERRCGSGLAARRWVENEFSLPRLCDKTLAVYQVARERRRPGHAR